MFRVVTHNVDQTFDRWTDALDAARALMPSCKRWTQDIRIFLCDELVWLYSREHKYPKYIGPGTYNLLAKLFIQEAMEADNPDTASDDDRPSNAE